ncbi:MAG: hypothetical protein L0Z55_02680 [Planctomycetes bacterium]|nr:hypothetical protein [Planctomycetota bacterium]
MGEEDERWAREIELLAWKAAWGSRLRLAFFAIAVGTTIWGGAAPALLAGVVLPALIAFFIAFVRHEGILRRKSLLEARCALARESAARRARLRSARPAAPPPGVAESEAVLRGERGYEPESPAFALEPGAWDDLQLFDGTHSLCGLLDLSSTVFGARRLRYLLSHPLLDASAIQARQEAVREIAGAHEFLKKILEVLWPLRSANLVPLPRTLRAESRFARRRVLFACASILGTAVPAAILAGLIWPQCFFAVVPLLAVNALAVGVSNKQAALARNRLLPFAPLIDGLLALAACVRASDFESGVWRGVARVLAAEAPAARRLRRALRLIEFHSYGVLFEIVNVAVLWELRLLPRAERLLDQSAEGLVAAMGAIGECEALLSLAAPLVEQRDFSMPEALAGTAPRIEARALAHPLLPPGVAVANGIRLAAGDNVWIITGSNMSGKSTFLKAVGTNLLLAGAGGPICGTGMKWTPVGLYTDVNIRDSLDDGKSYFQVEVERVRRMIDAAARTPMILAMFDELFRGTNSLERLAIARAILRALCARGILVIAATHDGALTRLAAADDASGISNHHFREEVRDGTMHFDYTLRPGAAPTRNAVRVLEVSGYPKALVDEILRELEEPASEGRERSSP